MATQAMTPRLRIAPRALVLEIGSGHRPHPRADILTDKYMEDIERGGKLVADRPFVQADAEQLPFKPKAFDYVICRQVLEHLEKPVDFFEEVSRVGHGGYIEAPSVIWEHMHPCRTYHRWYVLEVDNRIVMMQKPPQSRSIFGQLFEVLNRNSPEYRLFLRRYADLFYVRYQCQDAVEYCVDPEDERYRSWFAEPWDIEKAESFVTRRTMAQQALDLLFGAFGSVWGGLWRLLPKPRFAPRHQVELAALMQCPVCRHQVIKIDDDRAHCTACGWSTIVFLPV